MSTKPDFDELIRELCDAHFDCGEWREGYDDDLETLSARAEKAENALRLAIGLEPKPAESLKRWSITFTDLTTESHTVEVDAITATGAREAADKLVPEPDNLMERRWDEEWVIPS